MSAVSPVSDEGEHAPRASASADPRVEVRRLRAGVAACLSGLARRMDETLAPALASATWAWDRIDDLTIIDPPLSALIGETRRALARAAAAPEPALRAVALEGRLALDAAGGLTRLAERRLSSLIRLRVRSEHRELLPSGRPFLDLGAALAEAAREWA